MYVIYIYVSTVHIFIYTWACIYAVCGCANISSVYMYLYMYISMYAHVCPPVDMVRGRRWVVGGQPPYHLEGGGP